jgi:hypothetical protein
LVPDDLFEDLYEDFLVPGATADLFRKGFLEPCDPSEKEKSQQLIMKTIDTFSNCFTSYAMFIEIVGLQCRKFNRVYRRFLKAQCEHCCPLHCVEHNVQKARRGKFVEKKTKSEIRKLMERYAFQNEQSNLKGMSGRDTSENSNEQQQEEAAAPTQHLCTKG